MDLFSTAQIKYYTSQAQKYMYKGNTFRVCTLLFNGTKSVAKDFCSIESCDITPFAQIFKITPLLFDSYLNTNYWTHKAFVPLSQQQVEDIIIKHNNTAVTNEKVLYWNPLTNSVVEKIESVQFNNEQFIKLARRLNAEARDIRVFMSAYGIVCLAIGHKVLSTTIVDNTYQFKCIISGIYGFTKPELFDCDSDGNIFVKSIE